MVAGNVIFAMRSYAIRCFMTLFLDFQVLRKCYSGGKKWTAKSAARCRPGSHISRHFSADPNTLTFFEGWIQEG